MPLACKSQILIHGYGSTGKAGLGLKILFTPILSKHSLDNVARFPIKIEPARRNKVLIVSFLYPEDYYLGLAYKINKQFVRIYESYAQCSSQIVVKAFFPGYLTPEDFVYKIIRLLDEANLEGEPFSGILLDGLHNIYLQFKNLQKSDMIWPLLYSLLSRFNLTVVTTFTNFSITETHLNRKFFMQNSSLQSPDDLVILQQGQRPFLHGLVKAADYYIILEEVIDDSLNFQRNYLLSVKSSIRQKPPTEYLQYDRNNLIFDRAIPPNEIFEKIRTYHD